MSYIVIYSHIVDGTLSSYSLHIIIIITIIIIIIREFIIIIIIIIIMIIIIIIIIIILVINCKKLQEINLFARESLANRKES